jgi:uncharacterized membrane protein
VTKRRVVALLALLGCFIASYLTLYKLGYIGQLSCAIGSCERVNTSRWAVFLGAPVALWGVAFYVVVFAVAVIGSLPHYSDERGVSVLLASLSLVGVLFTAYLTSLELFVIHAICIWCVVSACIVTVIFVVSALDLREIRCNTT